MKKNMYARIASFLFLMLVGLSSLAFYTNQIKAWVGLDQSGNGQPLVEGVNDGDDVVNNALKSKMTYVQVNTFIRDALGQNVKNDNGRLVMKLNNGYLTYYYERTSDEKINQQVSYYTDLYQYCKGKNIPMIYFQAPNKVDPDNPQLPDGYTDNCNDAIDRYLKGLKSNGVPYVDLRTALKNDFDNYYECFFITDHHWLPETAFWASGKILVNLGNAYNIEYNKIVTNENQYSKRVYNEWFLGSLGKKAGKNWSGVDNITLIYPNFITNLSVETHSVKEEVTNTTGDFLNSIIVQKNLQYRGEYPTAEEMSSKNCYAAYTGGDFPKQIVKNNRATNDTKLLILRDSFACGVTPFLSVAVAETHVLDLRYLPENFSVQDYINEINPDAVLCLFSETNLVELSQ
jgi:hypothetical protein